MGVLTYNKSSEKSATGTYNRHKYKDNENIIRINGGCPAIITSDVFYTARDRQLYNKQVSQSNRTRQKYLLSGMLYCDVCGSPLYANRRKKILKSHTDVAKNIEVLINALVKKSTNNGLIQK